MCVSDNLKSKGIVDSSYFFFISNVSLIDISWVFSDSKDDKVKRFLSFSYIDLRI